MPGSRFDTFSYDAAGDRCAYLSERIRKRMPSKVSLYGRLLISRDTVSKGHKNGFTGTAGIMAEGVVPWRG